jgi:hypothetical protein
MSGQRHDHDVLIERDNEHRTGQQRQSRGMAWPASDRERPPAAGEGTGMVGRRGGHGRRPAESLMTRSLGAKDRL